MLLIDSRTLGGLLGSPAFSSAPLSITGRFLESYYIIVSLSSTGDNGERKNMGIIRHTLPHFLGVERIAEQYLNEDVKVRSY